MLTTSIKKREKKDSKPFFAMNSAGFGPKHNHTHKRQTKVDFGFQTNLLFNVHSFCQKSFVGKIN